MLLVVLCMTVIIPLLAMPSNPAMQNYALKALQVMTALLAGILILRARVATRRAEVITFLATGPNLAILLYFASCIVSLVLGPKEAAMQRLSFAELQRILAGILLYFALAYHIRRSEHLVKIQDALVLVCGLMAILGLLTLSIQSASSHAILFGDHQLFGAFMMILLPVPLISALTERDSKRQITAQIIAALTGICLLMTGTRTAWLGALAAVVSLAVFSLIGVAKKKRDTEGWRKYVIPLSTVILCGVLFFAMGGAGNILSSRLNESSQKQSMDYREKMWYAAIQLIILKPAFGTGLGTYPALQKPYSNSGRPEFTVLQSRPTLGEMAHNFWLQTAAEQGLIGAGLFAAIIVTFLVSGLRRLRYMETGLKRTLLLACLAGIVGFCVDAIGNPAWQFAQVSMFFWLILGLGTACLRPRNARQEE